MSHCFRTRRAGSAVGLASALFALTAQDSTVDRMFRHPFAQPPDWMKNEIALRDPAADGWPTEVLHDRVRPVLLEFLSDCLDSAKSPDAFAPLLATDFAGTSELRPKSLEVVANKGNFEVRRPKAIDASLRAKPEFARSLEEFRRGFAGAKELRSELELVSVEPGDEQHFATLALVRTVGTLGDARIAMNFQWKVSWSPSESKAKFGVRSVELTDFEQVICSRPPFADYTRWVFGNHPWFESQFLHGLDDFYYHCDQATGNHLLGGQGIAVGDVDGDGLDDVYVAMQGGVPNRLFMHQSTGSATDRAADLHVDFLENTRGCLLVDLDNDADQDLVLAIGPSLALCYNKGDGTFDPPVWLAGDGTEEIFSVAAGDADGDGDLDLYACRYVAGGMIGGVPLPYFDANNGASNFFWRNDGERKWTNATKEAGFDAVNHKYSLAALWDDFDGDGDQDLLVTNDFGRNNLFVNDGRGHFTDAATEHGLGDLAAHMGASSADVDLDGNLDLYVSNMWSAVGQRVVTQRARFHDGAQDEHFDAYFHHASGNSLLLGDGHGKYRDVSQSSGTARGGWSWGSMFFDFENDGLPDLYVPNGFITNRNSEDIEGYFWRRVIGGSPPNETPSEDYRHAWASMQHASMADFWSYNGNERNCVYLNLGGAKFADVGAASGLDFQDDGRAVARVDWDDDGLEDLIIKNRTAPRLRFLRNQAARAGHFVQVELQGTKSNRDGIGARVVVELDGGKKITKTLYAGEGYLAQSSKRLQFGLGDATAIARIRVRWPSGTEDTIDAPKADTRLRIVEGLSVAVLVPSRSRTPIAQIAPESNPPTHVAVTRVPLVEKLPLAELALPSFGQPNRKVKDLAGDKPVLVHCFSSRGDMSGVKQLLAQADELSKHVRVVLMSVDEGASLAKARKAIAGTPLESDAGYVDGACSSALEIFTIEIFGRADLAPVPLSFLLDKAGQLVCVYEKSIALNELYEDVALLDKLDLKAFGNPRFFGGRWIVRPKRNYDTLVQVFNDIGQHDLADFLKSTAARRAQQEASGTSK